MIRVAFPLAAGRDWAGTGAYNYLVNLAQVLVDHAGLRVQPVLFVGTDAVAAYVQPFAAIPGVQIVRSPALDHARRGRSLREALLRGRDRALAHSLRKHHIDVVFEHAQFYGWRFPIPTVAWITDFQHRHLRDFFSPGEYWKRDLGFRAQVLSGRLIILSSEDSRRDCETFLPRSIGRTTVVHFAVLPPDLSGFDSVQQTANSYHLPEHFFYLPNQFWMHKNHRVVIEALHRLKQQGHNHVVATTGKPDDYRNPDHFKTIRLLIDSHGLAGNFLFLGMVPRQHVFALMRACTALINPSLSEGWSTTVEEAKSLGVPMLLSNLRVHREQAGDSALFFDPQAAGQLARMMAQHPRLSEPSRRRIEGLAIAASQIRVRRFAADFADTVARARDESATTREHQRSGE